MVCVGEVISRRREDGGVHGQKRIPQPANRFAEAVWDIAEVAATEG
jgi:hypothetical protein